MMDDYVAKNREAFDRLGAAATNVDDLIKIALQELPAFQMLLAGGKVLDLGCGVGHDSLRLRRHRLDVQGLDISEAMLAEAKRSVEGVEFRQGDFRELPFEADCFDGVWANGTLFYVTPEDLLKTLQEVVRILKPSGVFFASYLHGEGEYTHDSLYYRRYLEEELDNLYRQAGFKTIDLAQSGNGEKYMSITAVK
ncbi:MAG: class I SAM-dependent methyltransferase [Clostridia bacterium]